MDKPRFKYSLGQWMCVAPGCSWIGRGRTPKEAGDDLGMLTRLRERMLEHLTGKPWAVLAD